MAKATSTKRTIKVSKAAVDQAFKDPSNWGRWGEDDQTGHRLVMGLDNPGREHDAIVVIGQVLMGAIGAGLVT
jgi:hypothetical protein